MEGIHNERYIQWKSPVHNEAIVLSIASPHIQTLHVSRPSPHFHHIFPRLWRQIWTFFGVRGLVSGSTGVQNHSPTWSTMVGKSMNSVRGTAGSAFQGQTLWLVWQALLNFYDEMQFFHFSPRLVVQVFIKSILISLVFKGLTLGARTRGGCGWASRRWSGS